MKITFEDQVQKFTDFFEDCVFKIPFEDQALKFTDFFFEDFILKITFEDQVQKLQIFFEVDHKSDPQNTIFIRSLQIFELCHAKWSNYPNSK